MSILADAITALNTIDIPVETGYFNGTPPNEYVVITPLTDTFAVFADDTPQTETQEARLSLFSKNNYLKRKNQLVGVLLQAGFTITDRRYIGHEDDTKYHQYAIDIAIATEVALEYNLEEEL